MFLQSIFCSVSSDQAKELSEMEHFIHLIFDTLLFYLPTSKMSIIIFLLNIQLVFAKKKLLCYNVYIQRKRERNMGKLILKKDWKYLTIMEWEGILEDVSEASTKFKYQTFTVKGERVYELIMKNDGKTRRRWTGNKLALLKGCSACHEEIIDAYLTGYCAGVISNRLSLIQKVSDCEMWIGMEANK